MQIEHFKNVNVWTVSDADGSLFVVRLFNEQRQKVGNDKILRQHFFKTQDVYTPGKRRK